MTDIMNASNPRLNTKRKIVLGCFSSIALTISLCFLFYWSWCWGWWGQEDMLLRWIFQCSCPSLSEEYRYPSQVDVLVPACVNAQLSSVSPSGRYLLIKQFVPLSWWLAPRNLMSLEVTKKPETYLLDIVTGEQQPTEHSGLFLTETEIMASVNGQYNLFVVDLTQNTRIPLRIVEDLPEVHASNNEINLQTAVSIFQRDERVYLIPRESRRDIVVGLAQDYKNHPEQNFVLGMKWGSTSSPKQIEEMLIEQGIHFQRLDDGCDIYNGVRKCFSHNRLLYIGSDIHTSDGRSLNLKEGLYKQFSPQRWLYEDSGVVLISPNAYVFGDSSDLAIAPRVLPVSQPILKLKIPEEYLSPNAQAREKAQLTKQIQDEPNGSVVFWAVVILSILVVAGTIGFFIPPSSRL